MGKNLNNSDIVMRTGKLAFYKCRDEGIYRRMEGFTELSNSKGTKEYTRQYVDEDFDRTDVNGYSPEMSYAFDRYKSNKVLDDIIYITENELIGQDMVRDFVVLDMTTTASGNGTTWTAEGKQRKWAVIPDTDGDTTDCMTYSGTFKCRGEMVNVRATTSDDWQTITVINIANETTAFANVVVKNANDVEISRQQGISNFSTLSVDSTTSEYTINVESSQHGAVLSIISSQGNVLENGVDRVAHTIFNQTGTATYTVTCTYNAVTTSMKVSVTVVSDDSENTNNVVSEV